MFISDKEITYFNQRFKQVMILMSFEEFAKSYMNYVRANMGMSIGIQTNFKYGNLSTKEFAEAIEILYKP